MLVTDGRGRDQSRRVARSDQLFGRSTNCRSCFWSRTTAGRSRRRSRRRWRSQDVADKAAGYGMPGMICDGTDPIATYRTMKIAMDRARSGGGPTLVEAKCYRFLSHSTDDDDRTYRDREDVAEQRKNDPVPKFERVLLEAGIIDAAALAAMKADVLKRNQRSDRRGRSAARIRRSTTCTPRLRRRRLRAVARVSSTIQPTDAATSTLIDQRRSRARDAARSDGRRRTRAHHR